MDSRCCHLVRSAPSHVALRYMPSKGFTMVELTVVVVILGVIAVFALPRFLSFSRDAQINANQATAEAFEASLDSAHLKWQIEGAPGRIQDLDGTLDMNSFGWPIGTDKGSGNDNIGRGGAGCYLLWNYLMNDSPSAINNASADYQSYRRAGRSACTYIYRAGGDESGRGQADLGIYYNSLDGSVTTCGQWLGEGCN